MNRTKLLQPWMSMIALLVLTLAACSSAATKPTPTPNLPKKNVTISGSGSVSTVIKYLSEAYSKKHGDLTFEFPSGSGTGGGVKGVLQRQLDLAAMGRAPTSEEAAGGIAYLEVGTDRVVIAISLDIPVTQLTGQQVKDILIGKITNWSAVGGPDATINVIVRDEADSATTVLRDKLLGKETFASSAPVLTSAKDMQTALSNTTRAIGFLGNSDLNLAKVKARAAVIDGHDPANLNDSYPYPRPVGIGYLPANAAQVQPFLDFVRSAEGQALLVSAGISPAK